MKIGKVSELMLTRSVFKNVTAKNENIVSGCGVGNDCSVINISGTNVGVVTSGVVDYAIDDSEYYTFYKAYNSMLAGGYKPVALTLNLILPIEGKEKQIKSIEKRYDELCKKHNMQIAGGHTQFSKDVNTIITSVTIIGEKNTDFNDILKGESEIQLVMTKALGIEGTAIIAKDEEANLRERFNGRFCDECLGFKQYVSVEKEAKIAADFGTFKMHDLSAGGVFAAIWEMASFFGMGAEIDMRAIPVWQETIEVTELFGINPYRMVSQGSLLIATHDGEGLVELLSENDIPAAVIGTLTEGNDKVLFNNGEKRFLESPRGDDIYEK
ncbi:MAG: hydrogenase maturation factor [Lachnospiraceae bacterium]|nr:hydrogenase maturation factor [Lachnospiraceae bacterium]